MQKKCDQKRFFLMIFPHILFLAQSQSYSIRITLKSNHSTPYTFICCVVYSVVGKRDLMAHLPICLKQHFGCRKHQVHLAQVILIYSQS